MVEWIQYKLCSNSSIGRALPKLISLGEQQHSVKCLIFKSFKPERQQIVVKFLSKSQTEMRRETASVVQEGLGFYWTATSRNEISNSWRQTEETVNHTASTKLQSDSGFVNRSQSSKVARTNAFLQALKIKEALKLIWNFTGSWHNASKSGLMCWLAYTSPRKDLRQLSSR